MEQNNITNRLAANQEKKNYEFTRAINLTFPQVLAKVIVKMVMWRTLQTPSVRSQAESRPQTYFRAFLQPRSSIWQTCSTRVRTWTRVL